MKENIESLLLIIHLTGLRDSSFPVFKACLGSLLSCSSMMNSPPGTMISVRRSAEAVRLTDPQTSSISIRRWHLQHLCQPLVHRLLACAWMFFAGITAHRHEILKHKARSMLGCTSCSPLSSKIERWQKKKIENGKRRFLQTIWDVHEDGREQSSCKLNY